MYRLSGKDETGRNIQVALRISDGVQFPFSVANTDYQQFKVQVADGTPLEDPEGNVMTQEQVDEFLRTIP